MSVESTSKKTTTPLSSKVAISKSSPSTPSENINPMQEIISASSSVPGPEKKIKVYTKTGDKGTSQLYNGERRPKDDDVFEALGAVDELASCIGVAREFCLVEKITDPNINLPEELEEVMSRLLDVGAAVATPLDTTKSQAKLNRVAFDSENIARLEKSIDKMEEQLPPLKNFILPVC